MGEIGLHWFLPVLQFIESQYWLCKGGDFPCVSKGWPWIASATIEGWPWPVVGDWWWGEVPKPFLEFLEVVVASRQLPSTAGSRRLLVRKARWGRRACKAPSQNEIRWKDACQFSIYLSTFFVFLILRNLGYGTRHDKAGQKGDIRHFDVK